MREQFERLVTLWALAAGLVLLAITLVTTLNIGAFTADRVARMFDANVPGLPGYEDFVRLAISCAALMFMPYCQLKRGHVAVDLFVKAFPARIRIAMEVLSLIGMTILVGFLAYYMVFGMLETYDDEAVSRVLGWPEWPFYIPGIISLVLWAVAAALLCKDAVTGRLADV